MKINTLNKTYERKVNRDDFFTYQRKKKVNRDAMAIKNEVSIKLVKMCLSK